MNTPEDTSWHTAGRRDFDLNVITGTHHDHEPEHRAAHTELRHLRANLECLGEQHLRDYLTGLLAETDLFFK